MKTKEQIKIRIAELKGERTAIVVWEKSSLNPSPRNQKEIQSLTKQIELLEWVMQK